MSKIKRNDPEREMSRKMSAPGAVSRTRRQFQGTEPGKERKSRRSEDVWHGLIEKYIFKVILSVFSLTRAPPYCSCARKSYDIGVVVRRGIIFRVVA